MRWIWMETRNRGPANARQRSGALLALFSPSLREENATSAALQTTANHSFVTSVQQNGRSYLSPGMKSTHIPITIIFLHG